MATDELSLQIHILFPSVPKPIFLLSRSSHVFTMFLSVQTKVEIPRLVGAWHRLLPCRGVDKPAEWGRRKILSQPPPIKKSLMGGFFSFLFSNIFVSDTKRAVGHGCESYTRVSFRPEFSPCVTSFLLAFKGGDLRQCACAGRCAGIVWYLSGPSQSSGVGWGFRTDAYVADCSCSVGPTHNFSLKGPCWRGYIGLYAREG